MPWFFDGPNRNRWFTYCKGMFHGYVSHNQMVKNRPGTQLVGDGFIYGTTGLPHESLLALNLFM